MRTRWTKLGVLAVSAAAVLAGGGTAQGVGTNVALNALTFSTYDLLTPALPCTLGSGSENAVDGAASNIYTDKWCVLRGKPTLTIQLPLNAYGFTVNQIVVKHAGVAGESPTLNTRAYTLTAVQQLWQQVWDRYFFDWIWVSTPIETTVATVTANTANQTVHNVSLDHVTALDLTVDVPTQGTNTATRIYEVEVWGVPSAPPS